MKDKNDFEYNYVAPSGEERKEIESIRNSYMSHTASNKLLRLRKLDFRVRNTPTMVALILGVIGLLIFGLGMAMVLEWKIVVWGVIVGIIGCVPMILAYPTCIKLSKYLKNKHSEEILKLSDELLNDGKE